MDDRSALCPTSPWPVDTSESTPKGGGFVTRGMECDGENVECHFECRSSTENVHPPCLNVGFRYVGRSTDPCVAFLFDAWTLNTRARFVMACVATLAMGVAVGALGAARRLVRIGRGSIVWRSRLSPQSRQQARGLGKLPPQSKEPETGDSGRADLEGGVEALLLPLADGGAGGAWETGPALGQEGTRGVAATSAEDSDLPPGVGTKAVVVVLYGSQLTLGYLLMLIAMTYQVPCVFVFGCDIGTWIGVACRIIARNLSLRATGLELRLGF